MWSVATPQKNGAFGQKERLRVSWRSRQGKKKAGQLSEGQKQQTQKGMEAKAGRMKLVRGQCYFVWPRSYPFCMTDCVGWGRGGKEGVGIGTGGRSGSC